MRKPVTPTMWSGTLVAAHSRAMLPVLGGISGSTSATESIKHNMTYSKPKKKRRASLEGLVVSFVRPRRPQMFVCAGGRYVLKAAGSSCLFLDPPFLPPPPFFAAFLVPPFLPPAFFPPFLVAIASMCSFFRYWF